MVIAVTKKSDIEVAISDVEATQWKLLTIQVQKLY